VKVQSSSDEPLRLVGHGSLGRAGKRENAPLAVELGDPLGRPVRSSRKRSTS